MFVPRSLSRRTAGRLFAGLAFVAALGIASATPAFAAPVPSAGPATAKAPAASSSWSVVSPDRAVEATVRLSKGRLDLTTSRDGQKVLSTSSLGLVTSTEDLSTGLKVRGTSTRQVRQNYTMVTGKQLRRTVDENELTLHAQNADNARIDVVIRADDDGVAFRYKVVATGDYTVTKEPITYTLPKAADAWLQPYGPQYENDHVTTTSKSAATGDFGFPATFRSGSTYTLLTESAVTGTYAASHLTHTTGSAAYGLDLYEKTPVTASGDLVTPWRVEIVGSAVTLVESTLVDDLAPASRIHDTSWIAPGVSAWSWFTGGSTTAQGSLALQEQFVDLAAKNGWKYALIDEGWKSEWVPELVRYAQARDVNIIAWFNSDTLQTEAARTQWFDKLNAWGVKGIKVDFMDSDSQKTFQWYDSILTETAADKLMINFHGATIPKGIQREWPQIMGYEAVRGEENGRSATRNTILPFTRNVVGSMDYTPGVFTNNTQTSKAQEVALSVLYETGWQHLADSPAAYAANPAAEQYLQNIPTVWDATKYVSGAPGSSAVIARRSGSNWFYGGITAGSASTMSVPLTALGSGKWLINEVTDNGTKLAEKVVTATNRDTLTIPTIENGGFALEACRATPGRTSCYKDVPPTPKTEVLVDADSTQADSGDIITVSGVFVVRQGGPVSDLSVGIEAPATWTVLSGKTITRPTLGNGKTVSGTWRVRVGSGGPRGLVDVPIVGTYTTADGRTIRSAGAATVDVKALVPHGTVWASDLDFVTATTDYGAVNKDTNVNGDPIVLGSTTYAKGISANANADVTIGTGAACSVFSATVGATADGDDASEASVTFQVLGDGVLLKSVGSDTDPITIDSTPENIDVDVSGVSTLELKIGDAGDGINNDHGTFANAKLTCSAADTTAPVASIATTPTTPGAGGWFTSTVTTSVTASDHDAKLLVEYAVDGQPWKAYGKPLKVGEGSHSVKARATDSSGNVSPVVTTAIKVDTVAPATKTAVDPTLRTVRLTATDATSGVASSQYRVGGGSWRAYSVPVAVGSTKTTIAFRSVDVAGNIEKAHSVTVAATSR